MQTIFLLTTECAVFDFNYMSLVYNNAINNSVPYDYIMLGLHCIASKTKYVLGGEWLRRGVGWRRDTLWGEYERCPENGGFVCAIASTVWCKSIEVDIRIMYLTFTKT